jgi:hypothetical protein
VRAAATHNITVDRRNLWRIALTLNYPAIDGGGPVNVGLCDGVASGDWLFEGTVRTAEGDDIVAEFSFAPDSDGTDGIVLITLTAAETAKLCANSDTGEPEYFYDIFGTSDGGEPIKLLTGTVTVRPTYTEPAGNAV